MDNKNIRFNDLSEAEKEEFIQARKEKLWNQRMTTVEVNIRKEHYRLFVEYTKQISEKTDLPIDPEFIMGSVLYEWAENYKKRIKSQLDKKDAKTGER